MPQSSPSQLPCPMKKRIIDLQATRRVDVIPIRKALETVKKAHAEIDNAKLRCKKVQEEIDLFLATHDDPDAEKTIQTVIAKKMQVEIIPNLVARIEKNLESELVPNLERQIDKLKTDLKGFFTDVETAIVDQLEPVFRPYFESEPDAPINRARTIAYQTDDALEASGRYGLVDETRVSCCQLRPNYPDPHTSYDREVILVAERLIQLAEAK